MRRESRPTSHLTRKGARLKIIEHVLQQLLAQPQAMSIADLAKATGRTGQVVRNNLQSAMKAGLVARTGKGTGARYEIKDRAAAEQRVAGTENAQPPERARNKVRKTSKRRKAKRAIPEDDPTLTFFLSEDREIQIVRADGEGEAAIIPGPDALRLRDFLNRCAPMLETA